MPNKVNWLLVGTGDIARKRVVPAITGIANSQLVSVCDTAEQRAIQLAKDFGVKTVYRDFDEAVADDSVNAIYLATPIFLHTEHAIKALKAGKHVLVEKPLALSGDDALRLVQTAEQAGLKAGCAYFRRFPNRYSYTKDMLSSGEFGKCVLVRMTYYSWFNPLAGDPKYWRVVKAKSGGGPLSDMGSHMFDVLIGLFGMPRTVFAKAKAMTHSYEVEDSSVIIMEYQGGPDVIASFNWNSKTWSHEFEIIGTEAKIKWHPYDSGPIVKTIGKDTQNIDMPEVANVHEPLIKDFVKAIIDEGSPLVPVSESAKTNILLDAVYESAKTGKEIII